uniref:Uncharacterized protein n=1 Tax=Octopus bimaculoides TaxID=37653 RepID=A0A0L8HWR4_OCTBM
MEKNPLLVSHYNLKKIMESKMTINNNYAFNMDLFGFVTEFSCTSRLLDSRPA